MPLTLTNTNISLFRDFIQTRTGLYFPESKFSAIKKMVQNVLQGTSFSGMGEYILYLKTREGDFHLKKVISLLTTNETYFFRGKAHFESLENYLLPKIIEREAGLSRSISIWSAGCSTGEEPYSISILLKKLIPKIESWHIEIFGTDIDEMALKSAIKGMYRQWSFRGLDDKRIERAFTKTEDRYFINDEYKSFVTFKRHNLISDPPPSPTNHQKQFDIIFCRNVTIYFEKETTMTLARTFFDVLKEGGYLIVGDAEHSAENYASFKSRTFPGAIIYQKNELAPFSAKPKKKRLNINILEGLGIKKEACLKSKKEQNLTAPKSEAVNIAQVSVSSEEKVIFNEAMQAYFDKNYDLVIDRFLRIMDINSRNASACWMISHVFSNREDFEEAIAWSERAIKIDPLFKEPYYTLSTIYMAKGRTEEALKNINKALYIDPDFILAHFFSGNIYLSMKRASEAEQCFENARTLVTSKATDEIIFETEFLVVGMFKRIVEQHTKTR